mgnify:CR=1 FL=1
MVMTIVMGCGLLYAMNSIAGEMLGMAAADRFTTPFGTLIVVDDRLMMVLFIAVGPCCCWS